MTTRFFEARFVIPFFLCLLLGGMPFVVSTATSDMFVLPKWIWMQGWTLAALGIWGMTLVRRGRLVWQPIGVEIPLVAWVVVHIAATFASPSRVQSFWGAYQRYGGLLTTLNFVVLFFLYSTFFQKKKFLGWI